MKPAASPDARGPALLVVQTSFLGDVVLTTPLVSALRRRLAPRRLAFLVRPEAASLVAGHPDVDQVLVDDKRGADGGTLGWLGTARWGRGGGGRRRASRPRSARWRRGGRAASSSAPRRTRRSRRRSTIAPAVAPRCSPGARISPPWSRSSIAWRCSSPTTARPCTSPARAAFPWWRSSAPPRP